MTGRIPGVILAGGSARRMGGGDKCLLALGGRPLLAQVIDRFRPQVGAMMLNANGDPARFADCGLPVVADDFADAGPLAGVLAALDWAAGQGATQVATVAADTPFLPPDLVLRLQQGRGQAPIALATTPDPENRSRLHPTFGLWSVDLRPGLRAALQQGSRKMGHWAEAQGAARVIFDSPQAQQWFFNVNTPDDLVRAETILHSGQV
ncbi:Molybdenum cofactor guanylyltransferase [Thalassovita gelatinovora]|uniref:Molybdenum cofactor guanylyltransferase n=1 Tax=Thalassovita gelatinovora TaxID=53501 RepID=A0A0P1FHZ6_THAGE|nr:molybdenum cofactor guanylyltransferase MobA [Thalassovita gelatinovora]QIZ82055.1 molybdenum cofactor guanylyltransferase MobA [Thalassovita gelatinovora]CUH67559.1 Molybdenum cofactor guanylyltransferase [Thalassovita gelatinovora]SEP71798.1 molybdenum cofactor guanylyltransferase [Thalassovita gelatinovora]